MNRNELLTITATSTNCNPEQVERIIDAYLDTIISALKSQSRVELRTDFGSFVVREKGGDETADSRQITKVQRVVSFKVTPTLKKYLRQSDAEYIEGLRQRGGAIQIERLQQKEHKK